MRKLEFSGLLPHMTNEYIKQCEAKFIGKMEQRFKEAIDEAIRETHAAGLPTVGANKNGDLIALFPDGREVPLAGNLTQDDPMFRRACGQSICVDCGKEYFDHPLYTAVYSCDGNPFLRKLCNGDLVKL